MNRVIPILLGLILFAVAGPAAACGEVSREAPAVARIEIARTVVVTSVTAAQDMESAVGDFACHLSIVCSSLDKSEAGPALGATLVSRSLRPKGARGDSRPTSPPLPPPRSTFRI